MQCQQVQLLLNRYIDGEISEAVRGELDRHLEACAVCRAEVELLRKLEPLLAELPVPPLPADLTTSILRRAATPERTGSSVIIWRDWWTSATTPLRAAAVVILMVGLAVGGILGRSVNGKPLRSNTDVRSAAVIPLTVYELDDLGGLPDGSLSEAYLELLTPAGGN